MQTFYRITIFTAALGLGATAYALAANSLGPVSSPVSSIDTHSLPAPESEPRLIPAGGSHNPRFRRRPVVTPNVEPENQPEVDPHKLTDAEATAMEKQLIEARTQVIETALQTELRDPEWARTMETRIAESVKNARVPGTRLTLAQCGSTMCMAELDHESLDELEEIPLRLRVQGLPSSFMHRQGLDGDGAMRTVAYFARDGHFLPR